MTGRRKLPGGPGCWRIERLQMGGQVPPADIEAQCDASGATPIAWLSQPHTHTFLSIKICQGRGVTGKGLGFRLEIKRWDVST